MKRIGNASVVLVLWMLVAILTPFHLAAEDSMNGPWEWTAERSRPVRHQELHQNHSPATGLFTSLLSFFQKVISPVDGSRCPSYPTCAAYSKQAYEKHGAVLGTLMTVDRLIHEPSESQFSLQVEVHGARRIYDPVAANEFWKRDDQTNLGKIGK
ncbi:MAG: membrane protein insertion efficiency factor YidD [Deltaproteobacteria bacterium]|nr:MAG: membrane protein insertion efficiency factor YidD [Deltaproteobacteria bacterium]